MTKPKTYPTMTSPKGKRYERIIIGLLVLLVLLLWVAL